MRADEIIQFQYEAYKRHQRRIAKARRDLKKLMKKQPHCFNPSPCVYLGLGINPYCADGKFKPLKQCLKLWNGKIRRTKEKIVIDSYYAVPVFRNNPKK